MKNYHSKQGDSAGVRSGPFTKAVFAALLLALICTTLPSRAGTTINAALKYTAPNNAVIRGGVATIGTSGVTYFSIQSTATTRAKVIKLSVAGSPLWTFTAPGDGTTYDMFAVPALDAAGAKLYIGSDSGTFYCLNTSDGSVAWSYPVPTGTDKRIRSGAALDPSNPLGATVYFHCNNGSLYALNAGTGALRWTAATGNAGGPPPDSFSDAHPVSSSPAVGSSGVVYVGSADGSVYAFNPSTGAQNWRVVLNTAEVEPVEASIAIGQDGTLYVGTRFNPVSSTGGSMYAINPVTHTKLWSFREPNQSNAGYIASPVIDQSGFIYAAHFDNTVSKLAPATGNNVQSWILPGKLCQTPSINQNGLLIIGVSFFIAGEINEVAAIKIADPSLSDAFWAITQAGGQALGNTFGSPAIMCDYSGSTYVADALGKVFKFFSGAPMMAGTWPTLQCGNRRAGKVATYPSAISQLPPFYTDEGYDLSVLTSVNVFGQVFGQSYGWYTGGPPSEYAAAFWDINNIYTPGHSTYSLNASATAGNAAGDIVGYLSTPLAWPDGVNSLSDPITLATPGFSNGTAYDINESSTIVGWAYSGANVHTFRWAKNGTWPTPEDLNTPAGGQAYAYSITDNGRIAGKARFTIGGPFHAFNTGQSPSDLAFDAIDLGTMGGTASESWDMHESKGTVGRSQIATGYWRGFLLPLSSPSLANSAGFEICALPGVTRADWTSAAYSVNKNGQVVGYAQDQNLANRAVLYNDQTGMTTDLNAYVLDGGQTPASLGWNLTSAVSINDSGVIVGYGSYFGQDRKWIIYPQCQD